MTLLSRQEKYKYPTKCMRRLSPINVNQTGGSRKRDLTALHPLWLLLLELIPEPICSHCLATANPVYDVRQTAPNTQRASL